MQPAVFPWAHFYINIVKIWKRQNKNKTKNCKNHAPASCTCSKTCAPGHQNVHTGYRVHPKFRTLYTYTPLMVSSCIIKKNGTWGNSAEITLYFIIILRDIERIYMDGQIRLPSSKSGFNLKGPTGTHFHDF